MDAQYISCCISPDQTLQQIFDKGYFKDRTPRAAGKAIKRAIVESGVFDRFAMFKDYHVRTYRLVHDRKLFAVVVHSAIEHLFEIQ